MHVVRLGGPWWVRWGVLSLIVAGVGCAIAFLATGSECSGSRSDVDPGLPNPLRAVVSEELIEWRDWLSDGGFESGQDALVVMPHPAKRLSPASIERVSGAARTGTWGLRASSGPNSGNLLAFRSGIEKGEETRCTFWARSPQGEVELAVSVLGEESAPGKRAVPLHRPENSFVIGPDWTEVQFTFGNTQGVSYALLTLDIGPNMLIEVDDVSMEAEQWKAVVPNRCSRTVGGITVPLEPVAPIHFNVLIHIEDPLQLTQHEDYFRQQSAIFIELARVLSEHDGFLTIQPEEDWPLAATQFEPKLLIDLATEYGVTYSTHTHGPACIDAESRLRSNADCNNCRACAGWQPITTDSDPYTPEYVGALRDLLSEISLTNVRDHNGNFHYENVSSLADEGLVTWSAFKNHNTQATFDRLFTNPWRPTACDAIESPERFQTHDPTTRIIFIPGWGQAITRHPERLHERLAAMLSQILQVADPNRVNSFYIVTHVGHYRSQTGSPYITWNRATGEMEYGAEFMQDLANWDEVLTELIDPLVADGYLEWTSLPEIGDLFIEWEAHSGS